MSKDNMGLYGQYNGNVWVNVPAMGTQHLFTTPVQRNLIVNGGRSWINKRMAYEAADSGGTPKIASIGIGTSLTAPLLVQTGLITQSLRRACVNTIVGTPDYQSKFSVVFTAAEINGTTEVGIFYDAAGTTSLVARNVHTAINLPLGSSITFDYVLGLQTSKTAVGWVKTATMTNTYEIADSVNVGGVLEIDTHNGYAVKTSIATVEATAGTYWHDAGVNKTYIHATDNANMAAPVIPHVILIVSDTT